MNIVDSSAWLEYFKGSENAGNFSKAIEDQKSLIVPSIVIYEVFKKLIQEEDEDTALTFIAHIKQGTVVDLDLELALDAAHINKEHKLPMADSIILACARKYDGMLWTQDSDFKGMERVRYFGKR